MSEFNLGDSLLFKGVNIHYLDEFLTSCDRIDLPEGEFLFHQNETIDTIYVIEDGEIEVRIKDSLEGNSQQDQIVGTLKNGALMGEISISGPYKPFASMSAKVDTRLLKIRGEDLRKRIDAKEVGAFEICYNITKILCERVIETHILLAVHPAFQ